MDRKQRASFSKKPSLPRFSDPPKCLKVVKNAGVSTAWNKALTFGNSGAALPPRRATPRSSSSQREISCVMDSTRRTTSARKSGKRSSNSFWEPSGSLKSASRKSPKKPFLVLASAASKTLAVSASCSLGSSSWAAGPGRCGSPASCRRSSPSRPPPSSAIAAAAAATAEAATPGDDETEGAALEAEEAATGSSSSTKDARLRYSEEISTG
mmetsp:Transcript_71437/g.232135  ORF Transcript_71437/g.232135 Transcript_71437/m.232135 type:complete len:211 (+) Transcript_71437:1160-1792(+)